MAIGSGGIKLVLTWNETEAGTRMVIQRDTNNSFPSPIVVATLSKLEATYFDALPLSGTTYYYRSKHTKVGSTDSPWSTTVSDIPKEAA